MSEITDANQLPTPAKTTAVLGPSLLDVRNITVEIAGNRILDGLDLSIGAQEIHAVLGANGSGKSTLAYLIMGCEGYVPTRGKIFFAGQDLTALKVHERARLGITLGWQEPARFEGLSVSQYLSVGHSTRDPSPYLEEVGLAPDRYLDRWVDKTLSGGERHRIELASVLSLHPKLAVLDEPDAGIDMLSLQQIIRVIRRLKEQGGSVLLITHREDVASVADRASLICGGRIVTTGDPEMVSEHFRARTCVRCTGEDCIHVRA
jgi:Fe-S cluster assembly ATP-binding protein